MRNLIIYLFPMSFDIVVALSMFVGRHSFAERGAKVATIGSIAAIYGIVYIPSSFLMGKIITPVRAKRLMMCSIGLMVILLCLLANIKNYYLFLAIFAGIPFGTSLFFNSFQAFMLDVESNAGKSLSHSVGHYTFAWSTGFALGPVVSFLADKYFDWSAAYYMGAFIIFIIGIIAFFFKPTKQKKYQNKQESIKTKLESTDKALPFAGWLGLVISMSTFQIILTYWPLQAVKYEFSSIIKSGIEFSASMTQALSALTICLFLRWYHKPLALLFFGTIGLLGLAFFAFADSLSWFFIGACLFGIYSASSFVFLVYHAMFDKTKAVKRVSINEIMVGIGILAGPIIATSLLTAAKTDFTTAYLWALAIFAIGIIVQTSVAYKENSNG